MRARVCAIYRFFGLFEGEPIFVLDITYEGDAN